MIGTALAEAFRTFESTVSGLSDSELREASGLPGWTRAHVVAHVVLNGMGFIDAATALQSGSLGVMYPGGVDARDRQIDLLATAPRTVLLARLVEVQEEFAAKWELQPPSGACATAQDLPRFDSTTVPARRLRELQVHLLDLHVTGVGVDRWNDTFVDQDLVLQWPTVAHRTDQPVNVIDDRGEAWRTPERYPRAGRQILVDRRILLGWVLDRCVVEGLPNLSPWGNRSRWEHLDSESSVTQ